MRVAPAYLDPEALSHPNADGCRAFRHPASDRRSCIFHFEVSSVRLAFRHALNNPKRPGKSRKKQERILEVLGNIGIRSKIWNGDKLFVVPFGGDRRSMPHGIAAER